jgi:succinate dehydrogenase / fumarate reductase, membrane anchor subunit
MAEDLNDLRTPLGRVRSLGSAKSGTAEAWLLHVTSLALVPLTLGFVWLVLDLLHRDYNGVRAALAHPLPAIVLLAFILAGLLHMEIGARSIIVDYVQGRARGWALAANTCFCALMALACVYATLRITFT